tara:strand:- start:15 stop:734 length:720 start_codon:yes stop_codon:yes gene_type:complete
MKTASIIVIGNEILSGRTQDTNSNYLAKRLSDIGVSLKEIRVISDEKSKIIEVVRSESKKADFVFTSGGIGPTHDDITADSISRAFNLKIGIRDDAVIQLAKNYPNGRKDLNPARLRMARVPEGAELIENKISGAPGFKVKNVYVMAGVPSIFKSMVESILKNIKTSDSFVSSSLRILKPESQISEQLRKISLKYKDIAIGSYPFKQDENIGVEVVVRHTDNKYVQKVLKEVTKILNEQ